MKRKRSEKRERHNLLVIITKFQKFKLAFITNKQKKITSPSTSPQSHTFCSDDWVIYSCARARVGGSECVVWVDHSTHSLAKLSECSFITSFTLTVRCCGCGRFSEGIKIATEVCDACGCTSCHKAMTGMTICQGKARVRLAMVYGWVHHQNSTATTKIPDTRWNWERREARCPPSSDCSGLSTAVALVFGVVAKYTHWGQTTRLCRFRLPRLGCYEQIIHNRVGYIV